MPVRPGQGYGPDVSPVLRKLEAHYETKGCSEWKAREVARRKVRRQGMRAADFLRRS